MSTTAEPDLRAGPMTDAIAEQPTADAPGRRARAGRRHGHRVAYGALLLGTAALYLVNLTVSGWGNQFYAAAAEAGSRSWTSFLFGSLDASNFITVDKPPAALWVMDVSVKLF